MKLAAFPGGDACRAAAIARLSARMAEDARVHGLLQWDGAKGSIAGCLIGGSEPEAWETELGLSVWIAYALDTVIDVVPTARATEIASALLHQITPGHDTAISASWPILSVLDRIYRDEVLDSRVAQALVAVRDAHAATAAGEALPASAWRQLRRQAIEATDAAAPEICDELGKNPNARLAAAGNVIEAAGWDPARSPTVVAEVLRHWQALKFFDAPSAFGWTADDDEEANRLLGEMSSKYIVPNPEETRDVFQLLEEHHPEAAARLHAYYEHHSRYWVTCAEDASELLVASIAEPS